jgi:hypothetical protein
MAQEGVLRTVASNAATNFLVQNPRLVVLLLAVTVTVTTFAGDVAMTADPAAAPEMGNLTQDGSTTLSTGPSDS